MKEHNLPKGSNRPIKRVGRGEGNGHGKTSCRGHKGAGARAGYSLRAGFEGGQMPLYRKLPQRGFNRSRFQTQIAVVNVGNLANLPSDKINIDTLVDAGLVRPNAKSVKLLGMGEVSKSFEVEVNFASASAIKKIEASGGSVKLA
jgi:large subunit ribosomal protein L15